MAIEVTFRAVTCVEALFVRQDLKVYGERKSMELQFLLPLLTPLGKLLSVQETLDFYRNFTGGNLDKSNCFVYRENADKFHSHEFDDIRSKLRPGNFLKFYYYERHYLLRDDARRVIGDGDSKKLFKLDLLEEGYDVSFVEIQEEEKSNGHGNSISFGESYATNFS